MSKVLIYGSYGYTGTLILQIALQKCPALTFVLSGRDKDKLMKQARILNKPFEIRQLSFEPFQKQLDQKTIDEWLEDVKLVVNCAGPFKSTMYAVSDACLRKKVHYIDITGEIEVMEYIASLDAKAKDAGIMMLPAAGFDVVPTDCLALHLKRRLPTADTLEMIIKPPDSGASTKETKK
jgi:short subunit dehydrogenase-like uncharacterized protein